MKCVVCDCDLPEYYYRCSQKGGEPVCKKCHDEMGHRCLMFSNRKVDTKALEEYVRSQQWADGQSDARKGKKGKKGGFALNPTKPKGKGKKKK